MIPPEIVKALKSSCEMAKVYARSIDVAPLQEHIHRQAGIALAYIDTLPAARQLEWEPVSAMALQDGRNIVVDDIALTVAEGNTAMDTLVWPEDGYEYNLCRRVMEGEQ